MKCSKYATIYFRLLVNTLQVFLIFRINVNDHSLDISFEEWRDYLLFHPSADLADIISHWRHNTVSSFRISDGSGTAETCPTSTSWTWSASSIT